MKFNVIIENNGKFIPYDVIPFLVRCYNESKDKPHTEEEFSAFIKKWAQYQWWSRCEYEIILVDWPGQKKEKKIDVHDQVMMNIDIITRILMKEVSRGELGKIKLLHNIAGGSMMDCKNAIKSTESMGEAVIKLLKRGVPCIGFAKEEDEKKFRKNYPGITEILNRLFDRLETL